jgi:hypothetical protein
MFQTASARSAIRQAIEIGDSVRQHKAAREGRLVFTCVDAVSRFLR